MLVMDKIPCSSAISSPVLPLLSLVAEASLGILPRVVKLLADQNSRMVKQLKLGFCYAFIKNSRVVNWPPWPPSNEAPVRYCKKETWKSTYINLWELMKESKKSNFCFAFISKQFGLKETLKTFIFQTWESSWT